MVVSTLRSLIDVSWERSRNAQAKMGQPSPTFFERLDEESLLLRAARPVLAALADELVNEPVCIILTDSQGVVLQRDGGDRSLIAALDNVLLAPGFRYSEDEVGTNGIGTALEVGAPLLVDGNDHYSEALRSFSCAGALITHPTTGTLLGLLDITTSAGNSNSLLLSFAKLAARRIQERVLDEANELDRALLAGYYSACQHSGGSVIAVSKGVFIMNTLTQQHFDANDQAALLDQARESIGGRSSSTLIADLPSGIIARLAYRPMMLDERLAGGIIQIKEQQPSPTRGGSDRALAGLAGASAPWRHASQQVVDALSRSAWVVVQGESGAGKFALIAAAHANSGRSGHLTVFDAADHHVDLVDQVATGLDTGADLVIRHAHLLSNEHHDGLVELFQEMEAESAMSKRWVALTADADPDDNMIGPHLLRFFPRTLPVPPLRHHLEDLPALVRVLLNRAGAPQLTLSKQALSQLKRLAWPDNVAHLRDLLGSIVRTRRSGVVEVRDLPPECLATTRRNLSRLESLERDAIVEALGLFDGDKTAAADSLGMSRATIYRKIREFGIVTHP